VVCFLSSCFPFRAMLGLLETQKFGSGGSCEPRSMKIDGVSDGVTAGSYLLSILSFLYSCHLRGRNRL
jgi:hypothetical protein